MVTITGYLLSQNEEGEQYYSLIVESEPVVRKSLKGNYYLSSYKAYVAVPTTFREEHCKRLIGKEVQGSIVVVPCDPVAFKMPGRIEPVLVDRRYEYIPDQAL